ncbi:hypothetical protein ACFXD5_23400 [Streptomyces sp. NPDC059385]|uniref:LppU/SCO3897 family protein n=1 Tax=Streptomyces sp. NPDC059385 TaxID=3346817 RepID=UPI0036CD6343
MIGPLTDDGPPTLTVGQCVRNAGSWEEQDLRVVDCGAANARFRVTRQLREGESCAPLDVTSDSRFSADKWSPTA